MQVGSIRLVEPVRMDEGHDIREVYVASSSQLQRDE